jgi:hypothetical protein
MLLSEEVNAAEIDTKQLLWKTIQDPNVFGCVIGALFCAMLAWGLTKKYKMD